MRLSVQTLVGMFLVSSSFRVTVYPGTKAPPVSPAQFPPLLSPVDGSNLSTPPSGTAFTLRQVTLAFERFFVFRFAH